MSEGYVCKEYRPDQTLDQEMELVNRHTRRTLTPEEVYLFSVVLCDNDIDRDYERFSREALQTLSTLYVGKTGIFDHSMMSQHQAARIFSCRVEEIPGRTTRAGEPYCRLVARAYVPKTDKNADLIAELDAGIKKEVSVGCAVGQVRCSICGADLRGKPCRHKKGEVYDGAICHAVLDQPTDAYEWSFVAVPAQREAGVVKAYLPQLSKEDTPMDQLINLFKEGKDCTLSGSQSLKLYHAWQELEELAQEGRQFREELRRDVVRMSAAIQPELSASIMEGLSKRMTLEELKTFRKAYAVKMQNVLSPVPQLSTRTEKGERGSNQQFLI